MTLVDKAAFDTYTATEYNELLAAIASRKAIVRRVAAQSVASGGGGANLQFDTEDVDTDSMFAPTSDTVTIKVAGTYVATFFGALAGSGQFYQISHGVTARATQSGGATANLVTPAFTAAVNDTIKIGLFHTTGSNQNATGTLSVVRISS